MLMTTTEVPTFFGPSGSPLFGVLHLPVDNQIRGGVLICGSLGKEGMDSVRLHRTLADGLARLGFGVLRFDYLGRVIPHTLRSAMTRWPTGWQAWATRSTISR
jgi:predicted alpha/beta hydrolase